MKNTVKCFKSWICLILVVAMCFGLVACVGNENPETTTTTTAAGNDETLLNEALAAIVAPEEVTEDISVSLTDSKYADVVITLSSDKTNIISNDGKVTRQAEDATVTLTVTVTLGDLSASKKVTVTVLAQEKTDEQKVELAKARLASLNLTGLTANVTLPVSFEDLAGVNVAWETSDATVITEAGVVTCPAYGTASAQLTATITCGSVTETKTLDVTVTGEGDYFLASGRPTTDPSSIDFKFVEESGKVYLVFNGKFVGDADELKLILTTQEENFDDLNSDTIWATIENTNTANDGSFTFKYELGLLKNDPGNWIRFVIQGTKGETVTNYYIEPANDEAAKLQEQDSACCLYKLEVKNNIFFMIRETHTYNGEYFLESGRPTNAADVIDFKFVEEDGKVYLVFNGKFVGDADELKLILTIEQGLQEVFTTALDENQIYATVENSNSATDGSFTFKYDLTDFAAPESEWVRFVIQGTKGDVVTNYYIAPSYGDYYLVNELDSATCLYKLEISWNAFFMTRTTHAPAGDYFLESGKPTNDADSIDFKFVEEDGKVYLVFNGKFTKEADSLKLILTIQRELEEVSNTALDASKIYAVIDNSNTANDGSFTFKYDLTYFTAPENEWVRIVIQGTKDDVVTNYYILPADGADGNILKFQSNAYEYELTIGWGSFYMYRTLNDCFFLEGDAPTQKDDSIDMKVETVDGKPYLVYNGKFLGNADKLQLIMTTQEGILGMSTGLLDSEHFSIIVDNQSDATDGSFTFKVDLSQCTAENGKWQRFVLRVTVGDTVIDYLISPSYREWHEYWRVEYEGLRYKLELNSHTIFVNRENV